jgi:aminopeptidase N
MTLRALILPFAMAGLVSSSACQVPARTLTLLSSPSGHPVEGALIYAPGDLRVYRSDVRGQATLPEGFGGKGVRVHAKNHGLAALPADAAGDIRLVFDSALVNPREAQMVFDRADTLRGSYGPWRANNDLLAYDLDVNVDVAGKAISGSNRITFRMLEEGTRIQLDLFENMSVDSILFNGGALPFSREHNAVFVDFPARLAAGETHSIVFHYSGQPREAGRFGGMAFRTDSLGNPWVITSCQNIGASLWWPNKDQQPDEPERMTLSVTVPSDLVDVSNGRFLGRDELGNGTTRYRWEIHYPINNYSVSLNIGKYTRFADTLGPLTLDYWVLPYHLEDARRQFAQAKPMLQCFNDRFGEYPFPEDGFKLVEVPYAGMEHQSAVAYGNRFQNGYLERDWTGVGISPRFDFIIIHESAHEWFGNSVTANDVSDAWIHEGFGTWLEGAYVECLWGYEDAITYLNGYQAKVGNVEPIIGPPGVNHWPTQDQYFKGALFLNTLRHVVDDEATWWALLKEYAEHFRHRNIWTTDVINFFNARLGRDLRPLFQQYLYFWNLPVLELAFQGESVRFRWRADVEDFDMPILVRTPGGVLTLRPTTEWQSRPLDGVAPADWQPATDLFYISVERS